VWGINDELRQIREAGLYRALRPLGSAQGPEVSREGQALANFSSNDYLGLSSSAALCEALKEGVEKYGAGSGASRLVCGSLPPHAELESEIATFKGTEAALSFSSGYAVALGSIPALLGKGDVIILDKLSHACLVDAARLSGATVRVFPHNHLEKLERLLCGAADEAALSVKSGGKRARILVVTESVFSMDGDAAALREIVELKDRFGAWLWLDEAHAVGVLGPRGRGLAAKLGLEDRIDLQMGTLSKAVGLNGGYLAAKRDVITLLINRARSFVYSTAPAPAMAHAAAEAIRLIQGPVGDQLREDLWRNVEEWIRLAKTTADESPIAAIFPVIIGDEELAMEVSQQLLESGFLVPAIRFPTVAKGSARLRVTFSAAHELSQVEVLAAHLSRLMAKLPTQ
jgi:8-amino-7-oxononanoate synthase